MQCIYSLAEKLSASHQGLCSVDLVRYLVQAGGRTESANEL